MISLPSPVTFTTGSFTVPANPVVIYTDNPNAQVVTALFQRIRYPLVLWRGQDYVTIGDWTQAQAEAQVNAFLGNDPQTALQSLFKSIQYAPTIVSEAYPNASATPASAPAPAPATPTPDATAAAAAPTPDATPAPAATPDASTATADASVTPDATTPAAS